MISQLFIPKKIRVGFQERIGTYTGKLAYVIYYDEKGKLRKETSFEGWRDKKIEPIEFDNIPQNGFILNKNVERYGWSHFSSNRSYIRVYDSRGEFEFEITPENLIGILTSTDCLKRGFEGEFVYAYSGKDLVLLPTNSEEYKKSVEYTELQSQKISAKSLVAGRSYKTKKEGDVTYLGYFPYYERGGHYIRSIVKIPFKNEYKKRHIFHKNTNKFNEAEFLAKSDASFLAACNSDNIQENYPELLEKFSQTTESSEIVGFEYEKGFTVPYKPEGSYWHQYTGKFYLSNGKIKPCNLQQNYSGEGKFRLELSNEAFTLEDQELKKDTSSYASYKENNRNFCTAEEIENLLDFIKMYVKLANGNRVEIESIYT